MEGTSSNKLWLGLNKGLLKEAMISAQRVLLHVKSAMTVLNPHGGLQNDAVNGSPSSAGHLTKLNMLRCNWVRPQY